MSMTGNGCTQCNFTGVVTFDGVPTLSRFNAHPCHGCSPWMKPNKGGPLSTEDIARAVYPAFLAVFTRTQPSAAAAMPETFDGLAEEDREVSIQVMQRYLTERFMP